MQTSTAHVSRVQHAPGKPGAHRQATGNSAQQAVSTAPHRYSSDAVASMTALGIIGIAAAALFVLACGALLRYIATGNHHNRKEATRDAR